MTDDRHPGFIKDPARAVSLADEERSLDVIGSALLSMWSAVNELSRLRPEERRAFNVSIFGSARIERDDEVYREVQRLAQGLAEMGCGIITGGGPGLMQAANEGATAAGDDASSIGIRIDLAFEQESNPFVTELYEHGTFFTRLHQFVLQSSAFICVPGGIGTALELFMVWQLLQVGHLTRAPLILVGDMWQDLTAWAEKHMLGAPTPMASAEDIAIPQCAESVEEALAIVRERHDAWVSKRELASRDAVS